MNKKRVSITDVATAAAVSVTTVSHALSGKRPVSKDTMQKVTAAIEELGYVPNSVAQSLQSGSTQVIGVLVPDLSNYFFSELTTGVEDAAHQYGYSVVIGSTHFDEQRERHYLDMIQKRAIDGLVYAAGAPPSPELLRDIAQRFPIALADEEVESMPAILATADHRKGGRLLGEHLRDLGHTSALLVRGPKRLRSSLDREEGFIEAFDGNVTIAPGDFMEDSGRRAVLDNPPNAHGHTYTAVCALNDLMALGALAGLRELGLTVPDDVSVTGFDDIRTAAVMNPPLTTVRQPAYEVGSTAAAQLLHAIVMGKRPVASRHVLDVSLITRESTGAPPGAPAASLNSEEPTGTSEPTRKGH